VCCTAANQFDDVTPGGVVAAVVAVGAGTLIELGSSVPGLPAVTGVADQVVANLAGKAIEARWQQPIRTLAAWLYRPLPMGACQWASRELSHPHSPARGAKLLWSAL
jgi:hypothetical protein